MSEINYGNVLGTLACGGGDGNWGTPPQLMGGPPIPVSVYVYDKFTHKPISGATVKIFCLGAPVESPTAIATTDANGAASFSLRSLDPYNFIRIASTPEYCRIWVAAPGYATDQFKLSGVADFFPNAATNETLSLVMVPNGSATDRLHRAQLWFKVYDKQGKPVPGASVNIYTTDAEHGGTFTGGSGVILTTDSNGDAKGYIGIPSLYGPDAHVWHVVIINKEGYASRRLIVFGRASERIDVALGSSGTVAVPPTTGGGNNPPPSGGGGGTTPPTEGGSQPPTGGGGSVTPPTGGGNTAPPTPPSGGFVDQIASSLHMSKTTAEIILFGGGAVVLYMLLKR